MKKKVVTVLSIITVLMAGATIAKATDSSGADAAGPSIADSGFVEDRTALFYYAKFATSGFSFTGGSVSTDTPSAGIGTTIKNDSIYASICRMEPSSTYYLTISEHSSDGTLNYGTTISLNSNAVQSFVYLSISDGIPYTNGTVLDCTPLPGSANGSFGSDVSEIHYKLSLSTDKEGGNTVSESSINRPDRFSVICTARVKTVDETDEVSDLGKAYGYVSTGKSQYAGAALSYDPGTYLCIFYLTNIGTSDIQMVVKNGKEFSVGTDSLSYGKNVSAGYGYAIIPENELSAAGLGNDLSEAHVTLGTGNTVYAAYSSDKGPDDGEEVPIVAMAAAAVSILAIALTIFYVKTRRS